MSLVNIDSVDYKQIGGLSGNPYALYINCSINNTSNYNKAFNSPVIISVKDNSYWKQEKGTIEAMQPAIFQSTKFSYVKGKKVFETLKYIKVPKKTKLNFSIIYIFDIYSDKGHYLYPNMVDANGQPVKGIVNPWVYPSVKWVDNYKNLGVVILPLVITLTCNINNVNYTATRNCNFNLVSNTIV